MKSTAAVSKSRGPTRPIVFTGQVGLSKGGFIERVASATRELTGRKVQILSTGDMMYKEDPSIPRGEILKLPPGHLRALRRAVMRDVFEFQREHPGTILFLNTHACFRWALGPVPGQDFDHIKKLCPCMFVNVLDNVHTVHTRVRGHESLPHTLAETLIAREFELYESAMLSRFVQHELPGFSADSACRFIVAARGPEDRRARSVAQMIVNPNQVKVYPSFPMTLVMDLPKVMDRINKFRDLLAEHFVVSDPADVDEKVLTVLAHKARAARKRKFYYAINGADVEFNTAEVLAVETLIDRQICERDFKLIDQSDMIVSLIPELPDGKASISSGVERELHYAFTTGKKVFVVWLPKRQPSPFITNHAHYIARSETELLKVFRKRGMLNRAA